MITLKKTTLTFLLLIQCIFTFSINDPAVFDRLIQSASQIKNHPERINKIISFATDNYLSNPELALLITDEVLKQSLTHTYSRGIADAYNMYGIIYMDLGELDTALNYFAKGLDIYKEIDHLQGIVYSYNNIGLAYSDLGRYSNALENYIDALNILEERKSDLLSITIFINMAKLYLEVNIPEYADDYLKKAEELSIRLEKKSSLIYIYNMLGNISLDNNKPEKALGYYIICIDLCKEENNKQMIASANRNIGDVYMHKNEYPKALEYYYSSLEIMKELSNVVGIVRCYNSLSYIHYYTGDYFKANEYAKEALGLSKKIGFQEGMQNSILYMSFINSEIGNYELAYNYRIQYDSLYQNTHGNKTFQALSSVFLELEQERYNYEMQLSSQKKKIKNLILFLIIISVTSIFILLLFTQRNIIRRFVKKEDSLNKELTSKTIFLAKKNEVFVKLENMLNENKDQFKSENQGTIQEVINEIRLAQNQEVWKEFELYFMKVHKNFYKKVNADFPKLTVNERRLCALLKMNMTTKDISSITQQSAHSIDIARSRLRKKLGINNSKTSLHEFLANY